MRKVFGIPMVLSLLVIPAGVAPVMAGVSVGVSVGVHSNYVGCNDLEDDMDWDNMIVLNNDRIGFWIMEPSGVWVFRCRNMWYDIGYDEWRYGPWWYDYTMTYGHHYNGIGFHIYMQRHHPRYHARYFYHYNGYYCWHNHPRYNDRYYRHGRHSDYNAPRMGHHKEAVRGVDNGSGRMIERSRTTGIVRGPAPVRTDGGNRIGTTDRSSGNRSVVTQSRTVRENRSTRVQPSPNRAGTMRPQPRSDIRRK